ncbi:FAD-linked sulfhydryl oxidase ALR [Contarinia nasturtii]|uniref:FAD-linked sulfhydryl oxidase ALR n=1 Tax=Contarinia nasturtii TaxID=265458 RepID=UPI0012D40F2D|nr:FAD-linked sulfhydryl oxidase ALR [Contarinia nasturtii]
MQFGEMSGEKKPCRTCTDFKTWAKHQQNVYKAKTKEDNSQTNPDKPLSETGRFKHGCPLDKDDLGQSTWNLLHTMAAVYPDKPTQQQKENVTNFFGILSQTYPCDVCAKDLAQELKVEPIVATSNNDFSQWLCRLHNKVNVKLGKPEFDCSKVNERWRDGWLDGSCD